MKRQALHQLGNAVCPVFFLVLYYLNNFTAELFCWGKSQYFCIFFFPVITHKNINTEVVICQ